MLSEVFLSNAKIIFENPVHDFSLAGKKNLLALFFPTVAEICRCNLKKLPTVI